MELASVSTPAAALVAGLVTSLHCAGMCGPLACLVAPARGAGGAGSAQTASVVYHVSRLAGYTLLGAVAGGAGRLPLAWLEGTWTRYLPWILVLFFLAVALRIDQRLPRPAGWGRLWWRLQTWLRGRPRLPAAAGLGLATPLLPCGPLYFLVTLAALSGSAVRGMEFMLAFGLGTVPLLWIVQMQAGWWRLRLSPANLARVRSGLALVAALVIAWRLRGTLGWGGVSASSWGCF